MSRDTSRVLTEELGGSALSLAAQSGRLPSDILPAWPADREEWTAHAKRVRRADQGWFDAIRDAVNGASGSAAAERLHRAASGRGVVVTTGQQAGLFGGPLY